MTISLRVGDRVPEAILGQLVDGEATPRSLQRILAGRQVIVFGVPGAFTPVCTEQHAVEFVAAADGLKRAGYDAVLCIAPDNPWAVSTWARQMDPHGKVCFLSDANGEFARVSGLGMRSENMFLGNVLRRFVMTVSDGAITYLGVEPDGLALTCSRSSDALCAA